MKLNKSRFADARISPAWQRFLWFYLCFAVFTLFSGTFINTYLMKATGGSDSVMVFNIVLACVQPFAMLIAIRLIRVKSPLFSQRIGLSLYAAAFLFLFALGESGARYCPYIASIVSAANGFFFVTYALQLLEYSGDETRDACYGLQSALGGIVNLVFPTVFGAVLAAFQGFSGYRAMFAACFFIALLSLWLSARLAPVTRVNPRAETGRVLRVLFTDRAARAAMITAAASGFYGGAMSFYLNVLMYAMIKNEALIGVAGTCAGIAGILSSLAYARFVRPENRKKALFLSLSAMIAFTCVLLFRMSYITVFAYSVLLAALSGFFINPPLIAYFGMVEKHPLLRGRGGEVHALREFWYASGRVLGILLTLCMRNVAGGEAISMIAILALQAIPAFLMNAMQAAPSDPPRGERRG